MRPTPMHSSRERKPSWCPQNSARGFEKRYFEALQRDPNVIMAHAAATRAIAGLRAA